MQGKLQGIAVILSLCFRAKAWGDLGSHPWGMGPIMYCPSLTGVAAVGVAVPITPAASFTGQIKLAHQACQKPHHSQAKQAGSLKTRGNHPLPQHAECSGPKEEPAL